MQSFLYNDKEGGPGQDAVVERGAQQRVPDAARNPQGVLFSHAPYDFRDWLGDSSVLCYSLESLVAVYGKYKCCYLGEKEVRFFNEVGVPPREVCTVTLARTPFESSI